MDLAAVRRSPWLHRGWALLPALICALAVTTSFGVAVFSAKMFNDGDTWWHLAAGRWILAHHAAPQQDVFSFTVPGRAWQAHEWLSEVVMALVFRAGGWSGLMILFAAAFAATIGLVLRELARWLQPAGLIIAAFLVFACAGPSLLARPHLLALPIMVIWLRELIAAREANRAPRWLMAVLMAVWANLHGSWIFGFVLAGPFGLEALWENRRQPWPTLRGWGLFGILCLLAALATPHGLPGLIFPFQVMGMKTLYAINEWKAANFAKLSPFEEGLLVVLFVCLYRGVRVPPLRLVLLLLLLYMALQHDRNQIVLAMTAPMLVAEPIGRALGRSGLPADRRPLPWILAFLGILVLAGVRIAEPMVRGENAVTPQAALAHVPPQLRARPVINTYAFGGYLIFEGVRPFIDGRADMYGDAFFSNFIKLVNGDRPTAEAALRRYHVDWTILNPGEGLVRVMDSEPGWKRIYADKYAVVHVRTAALAPAAPAPAAAPQLGRP